MILKNFVEEVCLVIFNFQMLSDAEDVAVCRVIDILRYLRTQNNKYMMGEYPRHPSQSFLELFDFETLSKNEI